MDRRVAAIVLPDLASELVRLRGDVIGPMAVFFERLKSSQRPSNPQEATSTKRIDPALAKVDAVDDLARRHGIRPGQTVVEACALVSGLQVHRLSLEAIDSALSKIADVALTFGAITSVERLDTVWVDITGAAHLVGGEQSLAQQLEKAVRNLGHRAVIAISDGPLLAQAFARFGPLSLTQLGGTAGPYIVETAETKRLFASLPISALPLDDDTLTFLFKLGLIKVDDLTRLPRSQLISRIRPRVKKSKRKPGESPVSQQQYIALASTVELIEGRDARPLIPFERAEAIDEKIIFEDGIDSTEALLFVFRGMISRLSSLLSVRGEACCRIEINIQYDPSIARLRQSEAQTPALCLALTIDLPAPLCRPDDLIRAAKAKLERLELLAPAVGVQLSMPQLTKAHRPQMDLSRSSAVDPDALPALLVELEAEVGMSNVGRLVILPQHRPEHQSALRPLTAVDLAGDFDVSKRIDHADGPPPQFDEQSGGKAALPTRLLHLPIALSRAQVGDRITIGIHQLEIAATQFDLRLDGVEWWLGPPTSRDYFKVWLQSPAPKRPPFGFVNAGDTGLCAAAWIYRNRDNDRGFYLHGWWE